MKQGDFLKEFKNISGGSAWYNLLIKKNWNQHEFKKDTHEEFVYDHFETV